MKHNLGMLVDLKFQSRQLTALSADSLVSSHVPYIAYCRLYGNRIHPIHQAIAADVDEKTIFLRVSSMEATK